MQPGSKTAYALLPAKKKTHKYSEADFRIVYNDQKTFMKPFWCYQA